MLRHVLLAGVASILAPGLALAQTGVAPSADDAQQSGGTGQARTPHRAQDLHAPEQQEIVITGFQRNRDDILSGTSVVTGEELTRDLRPTIGDTLARQAGVSATSFGPSASRPVLRGFQGDRIRILTDGIGSLDVSSTSVDHAVAINPLTADRVEVLRGPSVLLFGSSAIGGVVNVIDSRIPRHVPDEPVHVEGLFTYGSAADERSANGAVDVPLGGGFVAHVDGNWTKTDDLRTGGYILTPELRAQAAAGADPEIRELAELRGRLPNSASETTDFAGGLAWIDGQNNVGLSVNRYDSRYGIPIRYSLDPAVEAEGPTLDLRQTRVDARAEIDAGDGFLDVVRFRGGYSDYRHFEIEDTGEIATTFLTEGVEGRLEFVQSDRGGWGGGFGVQYFHRDFSVDGEEKFLPANTTEQFGLFALQTFDLGDFRAEVGGRYEHSRLTADADADLGNPALRRTFDTFSGSIGGSYELAPGIRFGVNASHAQRAPSAEELFANGPHAGTQAFEVGDPTFGKEKSWGLEGTLRATGDGFHTSASIFQSWFDNYIYEAPTGAVEDDLPVFQYSQADARYFGVEFEASARLARIGSVTLNADGVADYVRATIDSVGPAPRIPPFRILGGLEAQSDLADGRIEVEHVTGQDRIAAFETPTDGYTMVNASIAFHPFGDRNDSTITLSANNIFDVTARRHASFLKDFAPLAGRDLRISARVSF
ncbi:TonB-dependent receptor [Sphingosinicella sp. LHD-64]|uniref:TonB-dependent receptor n=1 Tax=Sphingosinicella sp. LHD-64 TaxID=3072139 RepID=UPI00280F8CFD|nr:TonB-dependent receptor [Sphingosinicella sp. LHD-64]MDQ8754904.1 TonB-dependent receptor [Sphingosinicella sp. LHD-64]